MNRRFVGCCAIFLLLFSVLFKPILDLQNVFFAQQNRNASVLIDPGHGGIDGGAVGLNGTVEKGINLEIAVRVSDLFGLFGVSSALTRVEDIMLGSESGSIRGRKNADLKARVEMANSMLDACMLSIHLNSFPDASCHGSQVFYAKNVSSNALAKSIQTLLKKGLDPENLRVVKPAERGHYLLNHVKIPAVIIECGFISNRHEELNLSDAEYQKRLAACIVQGYQNYRR